MDADTGDEWDELSLCLLETTERIAGDDARDRVWRRLAGVSIYVPTDPRPDHPICDAIGIDAARAVCAEVGGVILNLPAHPDHGWRGRRETVLARTLAGDSPRAIALQLGCTERNIYIIRRSLRENEELPALLPRRRKGNR